MTNTVGSWLREIRKQKNMTQADVLRRMSSVEGGIRHHVTITQIEGGKYLPRPSKLSVLAHGYNLSDEECAELKELLLNAVAEGKMRRIGGVSRPQEPQEMDEATLVANLLKMPKEVRERIIRTLQAYDAS